MKSSTIYFFHSVLCWMSLNMSYELKNTWVRITLVYLCYGCFHDSDNIALIGNSISWWRHQMEAFSALLALCAGNSPVPVNSSNKGQWRGALMFSLICTWINSWANNREPGDLRRHRAHCDVIVMCEKKLLKCRLYLACQNNFVVCFFPHVYCGINLLIWDNFNPTPHLFRQQ